MQLGGRGWTLTEILAVIAVTAILLCILIPVTFRTIESGRASVCIANLRSISSALHLYAADNGGMLIPAAQGPYGYWYNLLDQYMGGTDKGALDSRRPSWQLCPSKHEEIVSPEVVGYGWNYASFGNNTWGQPGTDGWQHTRSAFAKLADISNPESIIIIGDSKDAGVVPEKTWEHRYIYRNATYWYTHARRHNGGGHYLFVDGHIEWMTPETLQSRLPDVFDREINDG